MLKFLMSSLAFGQMLIGPRDALDGEPDTEIGKNKQRFLTTKN